MKRDNYTFCNLLVLILYNFISDIICTFVKIIAKEYFLQGQNKFERNVGSRSSSMNVFPAFSAPPPVISSYLRHLLIQIIPSQLFLSRLLQQGKIDVARVNFMFAPVHAIPEIIASFSFLQFQIARISSGNERCGSIRSCTHRVASTASSM